MHMYCAAGPGLSGPRFHSLVPSAACPPSGNWVPGVKQGVQWSEKRKLPPYMTVPCLGMMPPY